MTVYYIKDEKIIKWVADEFDGPETAPDEYDERIEKTFEIGEYVEYENGDVVVKELPVEDEIVL